MDKKRKKNATKYETYTVPLGRKPSNKENALGLWVDRIGRQKTNNKPKTALKIVEKYQFISILSGCPKFFTPLNGWISLSPKDTVIIFPDNPVAIGTPDESEWEIVSIIFDGHLCPEFERQRHFNRLKPVSVDSDSIMPVIYEKIKSLMLLHDPLSTLERFNLLTEAIYKMSHLQQKKDKPPYFITLSKEVMEHINENYQSNISIKSIAEEFSISYSQLRRLFSKATSITLSEYLRETRISNAQKMLLETDLPLKQIAHQTGFEDEFHFMRVFKKSTGITAGKFRKLHY
ncbi:MAG: helix-turn-helix transcriptional regulator [Planctomycetota bacterium]